MREHIEYTRDYHKKKAATQRAAPDDLNAYDARRDVICVECVAIMQEVLMRDSHTTAGNTGRRTIRFQKRKTSFEWILPDRCLSIKSNLP